RHCVCVAQRGVHRIEPVGDAPAFSDVHAALEKGDRRLNLPLLEMKVSERPAGLYEAERLRGCLGDTQPLCSTDLRRLELAPIGERTRKPSARSDGGNADQTKALVEEIALDVLNSPGVVLDSLRVCADG